ncbi:hypothetical protein QVD17_20165 [Tagetes erecta]|uniref:Uncharacterized protein n=1 Tax=Tagetes erecta TaxID=13708 RepID=A0AAD8KR60_TARER|nr:hypothetical protein QVD17_20165 [Tagetes erecta]
MTCEKMMNEYRETSNYLIQRSLGRMDEAFNIELLRRQYIQAREGAQEIIARANVCVATVATSATLTHQTRLKQAPYVNSNFNESQHLNGSSINSVDARILSKTIK